jgi:site-specific recombinase XerD
VDPGSDCAASPEVTKTYIDFFISTIRNRNTRAAYARACWQFFDWCVAHGLELTTVRPFHVAAWIEDFPGSKPTIKLKLAAVRMLYDFLAVRQITRSNPAHSVRGPKYVVKKGKTPVWSREDAKTLLESIPKDSVSGLWDLALIAAMFYKLRTERNRNKSEFALSLTGSGKYIMIATATVIPSI